MKSCLWPEGPGKLSSGLDGTKLTGIWNASSSRRGREGSARGFNPISANLLDLGTPTSSPLQPMAETRTRTRTIEERLRATRNEPRRGRGSLSLGPPESFSFFDRTRTRPRPRPRNFSLPAKGSICEGPQSNKLALMGFQPREPGPRRRTLKERQIKRRHNTGQTCKHLSPFQGEPFVWMVPR